jgi:hypothetical protein
MGLIGDVQIECQFDSQCFPDGRQPIEVQFQHSRRLRSRPIENQGDVSEVLFDALTAGTLEGKFESMCTHGLTLVTFVAFF